MYKPIRNRSRKLTVGILAGALLLSALSGHAAGIARATFALG